MQRSPALNPGAQQLVIGLCSAKILVLGKAAARDQENKKG